MYTVIRKYEIVPGSVEAFIQEVRKSLVPIINRVPGFSEYSLVEVGENEVVAISKFESRDAAKVSAQQTLAWIDDHTELFFQGFSKAMAGKVRVHIGPVYRTHSNHEDLLQGVF